MYSPTGMLLSSSVSQTSGMTLAMVLASKEAHPPEKNRVTIKVAKFCATAWGMIIMMKKA